MNDPLPLVGFALVSSITPGPNNLMLMASGTNFGFARSIPHALGVSIGFTVMVMLVGLGLARVFVAFPLAHAILEVSCGLYLLSLAWRIANAAPPQEGATSRALPMTFTQAALFQWVNPKAWTMALTAVSVYAPTTDPSLSIVPIALVFGAINLPSVGLWTLMGVQLRGFLQNPFALRIFNLTAALALVATLLPALLEANR